MQCCSDEDLSSAPWSFFSFFITFLGLSERQECRKNGSIDLWLCQWLAQLVAKIPYQLSADILAEVELMIVYVFVLYDSRFHLASSECN